MARPRLDDEERRARTVGVRVTATEAAELRERAQAARLSMGAYLRRRALGQRVRMAETARVSPEHAARQNLVTPYPGSAPKTAIGYYGPVARAAMSACFSPHHSRQNSAFSAADMDLFMPL